MLCQQWRGEHEPLFWLDHKRDVRVLGVMVVAYKREVLAKNLEALKHVTIATNGLSCFFCFACRDFFNFLKGCLGRMLRSKIKLLLRLRGCGRPKF